MSVTGGFFNSLNGDRKYDAKQFSSIFDGVITEGVFGSFGDCFKVRTDGSKIIIGSGRAWLNSKWLLNDADLALSLPAPDNTFPRYDAVIFDINGNESVRANSIVVISGSAVANPKKPSMIKQETYKQYPICYIYRPAGNSYISNANIEVMTGKSDLPYVTSPLKSISVQDHFNKWDSEFNTWFNSIKNVLDSNTATALYNEITSLQARMSTAEGDITTISASVNGINNKLSDKAVTVEGYRLIKASTVDIGTNAKLDTGTIYVVHEE